MSKLAYLVFFGLVSHWAAQVVELPTIVKSSTVWLPFHSS